MRSTTNVLAVCLLTIAVPASAFKPENHISTDVNTSGNDKIDIEQQKIVSTEHVNDTETLPGNDEEKVVYNGMKVLRVVVENKQQRNWIKNLDNAGDVSIWSNNGSAIDVLIRTTNGFEFLTKNKLRYDVVIDDLQKAIEEENPTLSEEEWSELQGRKEGYSQWNVYGYSTPFHQWLYNDNSGSADDDERMNFALRKSVISPKRKNNKKGHRMTWQMYHRMADIYGYLDYLAATYPNICSLETIGTSVEGRPLKVLKISSGEQNSNAVWVDSGIHAREWITPATSTYIISQIVENGDGAHGVDWYFLPLVNPDGYEHTHTTDRLWRKNRANPHKGPCAGTDLNRNYGYRWGGQGASKQPCRETYAGSGAFSEPETMAVNKFVTSKAKKMKAFISLHSYGQYILYPWGYDRRVPPDYADLHRVGKAMAQAMKQSGGQNYKVGSAAATLYPAAGGADDWAKGTAKIKYAYTIELRDTGRHGFILPAQYITPTGKEAYEALKVIASEVRGL